MKTTITNSSILQNSNLRLDAGYHLSEGQLTLSAFEHHKIPTLSLSSVTERIFYGGRSRRIYVKNPAYGLPFIKGADIIKSDLSSLSYISKKRTANLPEYFLEEGWTVLTRSGTIGNTAFVTKDFLGKAASDDIIRVVPKSILPGFLYAFLSSKYGKSLLTHGTYGAVIQHIEPEHIENIPIPIFHTDKQQQIHDLIIQSAELRVEANRLLEEAVSVFDRNLCLKSENSYKTFIVHKEELNSRFDSKFVINTHLIKTLLKNLTCEKFITISSIAKNIFIGPRSKRNYTKTGIPFLSGTELQKSNPTKVEKFLNNKEAIPFLAQEGWILITRSGTIGNVSLMLKCLNNFAVTDDAIRIVLKEDSEITPNYLFAFLLSKIGKLSITTGAFGSVIQHINEAQIGEILIPILSPDEVKIVNTIISDYSQFVNSSILFENQAIELVEKEIDLWQN